MITNELIRRIAYGHGDEPIGGQVFTPGEREAIEWQYFKANMGGFKTALWDLLSRADESNLFRAGMGFPDQTQGFLAWTRGDLAERLKWAGEEFEAGRQKEENGND